MTIMQQLREYRYLNITLIDFIGTIGIAWLVHYPLWNYPLDMKDKNKRTTLQYVISFLLIFIMLLGIGVIFHRIFGIKSGLSGYLGFNDIPIRTKKST
mgnify:CR=1 FL=1